VRSDAGRNIDHSTYWAGGFRQPAVGGKMEEYISRKELLKELNEAYDNGFISCIDDIIEMIEGFDMHHGVSEEFTNDLTITNGRLLIENDTLRQSLKEIKKIVGECVE